MKKIGETSEKISGAISAFAMISVVVLIFINVVCRYFLDYSIPWCEELTRYMFIAVIFLTLNIMVSQGAALKAVSYTHLDVYKRQDHNHRSL